MDRPFVQDRWNFENLAYGQVDALCPVAKVEIQNYRYSYRGLDKLTWLTDKGIFTPTCPVRQVA